MANNYSIVDGNTRKGRLLRTNRGGKKCYTGERRKPNGKFEERVWHDVTEGEALSQWREWQKEVETEAVIKISKPQKAAPEEDKLATQTKAAQAAQTPKEVYVLAFVDAYEKRTDIGAYVDMNKAADMVDALTMAAKATGQKGEYDLFKLDVRW